MRGFRVGCAHWPHISSMNADSDQRTSPPMLPILEEIRNDLYQRNRCHERRRRRLVGGVISVATVLAASATVLLSGVKSRDMV